MRDCYVVVPTISSKAEGQIHPRLMLQLLAAQRAGALLDTVDEFRPVSHARNEAKRRFDALPSRYRWLVMVDLDTVPPLANLGSWMQTHGPICTTPYAMHSNDGRFHFSVGMRCVSPNAGDAYGEYVFSAKLEPDWHQYDVCGFGAVAFHRATFAGLPKDPFREEHGVGVDRTEDACFFNDYPYLKAWATPRLIAEHWRNTDITKAALVQEQLCGALEAELQEKARRSVNCCQDYRGRK